MNSSFSTLLIGDIEQPEFRAAVEVLAERTAVRHVSRLELALADCQAANEFPDLIVLAQSRPGQFDSAALDALRRGAPLARGIVILGSWCAGETRSGTPLAGIVRFYWHEAPAYLVRELERQQAGNCPDWGLPITATEFDRNSPAECPAEARALRSVAIHSPIVELAQWLERACAAWGYRTTSIEADSLPASEGLAAVIWDAWRLDGAELAKLQAWAPSPLVVLVDFPHWEDRQRAIAAGARFVLAKPLRLDDLRWHLNRLCKPAETVSQ